MSDIIASSKCNTCGSPLINGAVTCANCEDCKTIATSYKSFDSAYSDGVETIAKVELKKTRCVTAEKIIRSALRKARGHIIEISLLEEELEDLNEVIEDINNKPSQLRNPKIRKLQIKGDSKWEIPCDMKRIINITYGLSSNVNNNEFELSYLSPERFMSSRVVNQYTVLNDLIWVNYLSTDARLPRLECEECHSKICGCGEIGQLNMLYYPKIELADNFTDCLELNPHEEEYVRVLLTLEYAKRENNVIEIQSSQQKAKEIEARLYRLESRFVSNNKSSYSLESNTNLSLGL